METRAASGALRRHTGEWSAPDTTDAARRSLADYADGLVAAENADNPVQEAARDQASGRASRAIPLEPPIAVSEGAKGTGKTLAARFFVAQGRWDRVVEQLVGRTGAVLPYSYRSAPRWIEREIPGRGR